MFAFRRRLEWPLADLLHCFQLEINEVWQA